MLQACTRKEPVSYLGRSIGDVSIGNAWTILPKSPRSPLAYSLLQTVFPSTSNVQNLPSHTGTSTSQHCRARHVIDRCAANLISSDIRFAAPQ